MKYRAVLIYCIVVIFSFIIGGATAAWIIKSRLFKFENEINLTDLLTLVMTVLLALFITFFVEKTKEIKRGTKDLFISYYRDYRIYLESKLVAIQGNQLSYPKKNATFKLLRARLHELNELTVSRNIINRDSLFIQQLNASVKDLWVESTRTVQIDDRGLENIELILLRIENLINKFTVEINEA
ncbi:hypothetical protein KB559_15880 [Paenibacillus sp. Marseille-P2973]|uniref:hypothetical protein n=1 Tax=Paenibacillus sp. Marseille-P2973 TaxID=1871032 RepID=UPI001B37F297|nr:hypothetical protein [Paenibacillus sp. Marseille-P2973]MBQ4900316.1 hypothetical protein [Paenibacillus sp. Marseille-P2973]